MRKKILGVLAILIILQLATTYEKIEATVFKNKIETKETQLSPFVTHFHEKYRTNTVHESVNLLKINLNDPYTKLNIGVPNPINRLTRVTSLATKNSVPGHRVVAATNAAFYGGDGYPANLLAIDNEIINYGILGENFESPTQNPVAFGINKSGKAIADYFSAKVSFSVNGKTIDIDRVNKGRLKDKTVLYTEAQKTTGTNEWGIEIVVEGASQSTKNISFGDQFTGTVKSVTSYQQPANSSIPTNGFVISIQDKQLPEGMGSLKAGDPVSLSIAIDKKWQDAKYILAAGPLLVKNGKETISMPTNASFVKSRHPRTAVGVDGSGNVMLVTVDGRKTGHSSGTSLPDLAKYLISKGVHSAINLDGGGSTTMVVSEPGSFTPKLTNVPADGWERGVSAILQAVSVAPPGEVKTMELNASSIDVIKGASTPIHITKAIDVHMNPVDLSTTDLKWIVEGNIGAMEGTNFIATAAGNGKLIGTSGKARAEIKINVIDPGNLPIALHSLKNAGDWQASAIRSKASIATSSVKETKAIGQASVKLAYDFTAGSSGTSAAYMKAKQPISIVGHPDHIGVWVYGDGGNHWLRGNIVDASRNSHTIDFTASGGLNWQGWKYVTARVKKNIPLPIKFEQLYVAQPDAKLQNKGKVFFSRLQAIYADSYIESSFVDVPNKHWAYSPINKLTKDKLIKGLPNGTFQPAATISRGEAATLIARALNLSTTKAHGFTDVSKNFYATKEIAAVAEKGIFIGREKGKFHPQENLVRAEMATILKRAYHLSGAAELPFTDIEKSHWAYENIQTLVANNLTTGFPDNTFRPDNELSRAEFVAFLERAISSE